MEKSLDQGSKTNSATSLNVSSSISYELEDRTESTHMKALEQLTRKIDQILIKIQSIRNIRAASKESNINLSQASDKSISIKVEDVNSKGSIFNNLESIDNQIGTAHLEMINFLDELIKSKEISKCERLEAKKEVLQRKTSNCKRKVIRKIQKCITKFHVELHRKTRGLKYRKINGTTKKLSNRISAIVFKKPLLKHMFFGNNSNEFESNLKNVSIQDCRMETKKMADMSQVNNDNEIIVLYRRPIIIDDDDSNNNDKLNYGIPCKDNDDTYKAKIPCPHNKQSCSARNTKHDLKREIRKRIRAVSETVIGNNSCYERLVTKAHYEKPSYQKKLYSTATQTADSEEQTLCKVIHMKESPPLKNKNQWTKNDRNLKSDIEYHSINDVMPIHIEHKRSLRLKHVQQLFKYTFRCLDLKKNSKLSRCVKHSIKHSFERLCRTYHEPVTKYVSRILDCASLSYISASLIFKFSNISHTKGTDSKKNIEYCKVFRGENSSYKYLIRRKQLRNREKDYYYKSGELNRMIVKKNPTTHQNYKLNLYDTIKYFSKENQLTTNNAFNEVYSTKTGMSFDRDRSKGNQHSKYTESLNNDNIVNGDEMFKQMNDLARKVNTIKKLMDMGFAKRYSNSQRNSKKISQLIMKYNSNIKTIINRFNNLNMRMRVIGVKQTEIEGFMKAYITKSNVRNRLYESNFKNLGRILSTSKEKISLEERFHKEKFYKAINEQNNKFTNYQSELEKLNKVTSKFEEHLKVYKYAINVLKECAKFHSNKIENIDSLANLNAFQQYLTSNKLDDIEAFINNIHTAVQTSTTSLQEDIYTNRYLIEVGANIIEDKVKKQNEINEKVDEQMKKQDDEIEIILTGILELKKQLDERTAQIQRTPSIAEIMDESNPRTQDLLEFVQAIELSSLTVEI
ncbi:reticulocyte-binding protein PFD0110w [Nilaparvata lugens]|uniref:reticulocyte-binding protein PFD0110w n=1 Tax=Nilaparvata lugens TaxID=108931 RepID=UPI00193CB20C|nr:reticulocyte-binding protein PFD0110w [Nilaparvata lugens]